MEPSTVTIPFKREIKLYKADLEALIAKNSFYTTPDLILCEFSNIRYYFAVYPNGNQAQNRGQAWIFLHIRRHGIATSIEADVNYSVASAGLHKNRKAKYARCERDFGWGIVICKTEDLTDPTKKYMVYGELKIQISGILKAFFPAKQRYLISTAWRIKKSDIDASKFRVNATISSSGFKIAPSSDVIFSTKFFTNSYLDHFSGKSWIFIQLQREATNIVDANLNIIIDSIKYARNFVQTFTDDKKQWGFALCSTADLFAPANQFFVNEEMVVRMVGTLLIEKVKEPTLLKCEKGIVPKGYHRNRNFTFIIGEKSIRVHKHVLKAASTVFTAMFNSGMKEVKDKKMIIEDFEYEIVHAAMKLIYSSAIPTTFSYEQMLSLLDFADKYDIDLVKTLVEEYLIQRISPTNLCDLITFTLTTVNAKKLQLKCKEYLVGYFKIGQPIYGYERLDKDFVHQAFMGAFTRPI